MTQHKSNGKPIEAALNRTALRVFFINANDTMAAWARRHGFSYRTVYASVRGERRGRKSQLIVNKLAAELERAA